MVTVPLMATAMSKYTYSNNKYAYTTKYRYGGKYGYGKYAKKKADHAED